VDTRIPNLLVREALKQRALPEFEGWELVRPEYPMGNERIDFLLTDARGRHLALEVKSVSMMQEERGFFPDAVTARGTRHLKSLAALTQTAGWCSSVLFVAQREDVFSVEAATEIDPAFAKALSEARASGVGLFARRCRITLERIILETPIPVRT
jgi:sugar fermentation stimulation protein A